MTPPEELIPRGDKRNVLQISRFASEILWSDGATKKKLSTDLALKVCVKLR